MSLCSTYTRTSIGMMTCFEMDFGKNPSSSQIQMEFGVSITIGCMLLTVFQGKQICKWSSEWKGWSKLWLAGHSFDKWKSLSFSIYIKSSIVCTHSFSWDSISLLIEHDNNMFAPFARFSIWWFVWFSYKFNNSIFTPKWSTGQNANTHTHSVLTSIRIFSARENVHPNSFRIIRNETCCGWIYSNISKTLFRKHLLVKWKQSPALAFVFYFNMRRTCIKMAVFQRRWPQQSKQNFAKFVICLHGKLFSVQSIHMISQWLNCSDLTIGLSGILEFSPEISTPNSEIFKPQ